VGLEAQAWRHLVAEDQLTEVRGLDGLRLAEHPRDQALVLPKAQAREPASIEDWPHDRSRAIR
jgi:hypothetical protein